MPYIGLQDLLRGFGQLTPEQVIFINWFYSQFDNRSAANRQIINVEPIFYMDIIGINEFTIYAATKLYLCLEFEADYRGAADPGVAGIYFYNEANAGICYAENNAVVWDTTAASIKYVPNQLIYKNLYFSRLLSFTYSSMKFIGYRITLV